MLTIAIHQCFVEQLYGKAPAYQGKSFRGGSGTIYGSPLPRNRLTIAALFVVLLLLLLWMIPALAMVLGVGLLFLPAVLIPVLLLPIAAIVATETLVKLVLYFLPTSGIPQQITGTLPLTSITGY